MRRRPRRTAALLWASGCNRSSRGPVPANYSTPTRPTARGDILCFITASSASGNYDQMDQEHRKILGYDGCGYHFVIGNGNGSGDGQIEVAQGMEQPEARSPLSERPQSRRQRVRDRRLLVGDLDKQPPTPRQVAASRPGFGRLPQPALPHRSRPHLNSLPSRRDSDRLPWKVLPHPVDPGQHFRNGTRRQTSPHDLGHRTSAQPDDHLLSLPNRLQLKTSAVINSWVISHLARGVARLRATRR